MATKKAQNIKDIDYSELVSFISDKIEGVKGEIEGVRGELKGEISEIREILKTKADKSDINVVLSRINVIGNNVDDYRAEQIETHRQVELHGKWIAKAAPKIGVKIDN
jgi:hypothetical protein